MLSRVLSSKVTSSPKWSDKFDIMVLHAPFVRAVGPYRIWHSLHSFPVVLSVIVKPPLQGANPIGAGELVPLNQPALASLNCIITGTEKVTMEVRPKSIKNFE